MHIKTKERAISYLVALIQESQLRPPYHRVNVDRKDLREKYFGKDNNRKKYYAARNFLTEEGILYNCDNFFIQGKKSYLYNINYIKLYEESYRYKIYAPIFTGVDKNRLSKSFKVEQHFPISSYSSYSTNNSHNTTTTYTTYTNSTPFCNKSNKKLEERVKIGKNIRLKDVEDEEVLDVAYNKYPQFTDYNLNIVPQLNKRSLVFDQTYFQPKLHKSKSGMITSIGARAYNPLCLFHSYEKHKEDENPKPYEGSREQMLDYSFGEWEEYDVKGSIPTVARFINKGEIDLDKDPYMEMIKLLDEKYDLQIDRKTLKNYFLRIFFGGTPKKIMTNMKWSTRTTFKPEVLEIVKKAIKDYCGSDDTVNTEYFLHESCIYLDVMYELRVNRGIDCKQVYDAFYFKKGEMPEDMEEIIVKCAEEYRRRYVK